MFSWEINIFCVIHSFDLWRIAGGCRGPSCDLLLTIFIEDLQLHEANSLIKDGVSFLYGNPCCLIDFCDPERLCRSILAREDRLVLGGGVYGGNIFFHSFFFFLLPQTKFSKIVDYWYYFCPP